MTVLHKPRCSLPRFIRPPHHAPTCAPAREAPTDLLYTDTPPNTTEDRGTPVTGPGLCSFQPKPGRPATDQRYLTTCETVQLRSEPSEGVHARGEDCQLTPESAPSSGKMRRADRQGRKEDSSASTELRRLGRGCPRVRHPPPPPAPP